MAKRPVKALKITLYFLEEAYVQLSLLGYPA
jgi:hypothetical protein